MRLCLLFSIPSLRIGEFVTVTVLIEKTVHRLQHCDIVTESVQSPLSLLEGPDHYLSLETSGDCAERLFCECPLPRSFSGIMTDYNTHTDAAQRLPSPPDQYFLLTTTTRPATKALPKTGDTKSNSYTWNPRESLVRTSPCWTASFPHRKTRRNLLLIGTLPPSTSVQFQQKDPTCICMTRW